MSVCLYSCRPKRRVGAAIAVSIFFFCVSMAFSAVGLINRLRRLFILTALLFILVFFLVIKRFLATEYTYAVYADRSGGADIVVAEHTLADREPAVVCRIAMSDIIDTRVVRKGNKKNRKNKKEKTAPNMRPKRFYNYAVSMFEREYVLLTYADGDGTGELKLSYDEGLMSILSRGV